MLSRKPAHLEEEAKRLGREWTKTHCDIDEFFEKNASKELKQYYEETSAHVEEMKRQGVMV